jgi:hypothetical protein
VYEPVSAGVVDIIANNSARAIYWVPAAPVAICFQTSFEVMGKRVAGFVDKPRLNLGSNTGPKVVNCRSKLVRLYSRSAQLLRAYITRDCFYVALQCVHADRDSSAERSTLLGPQRRRGDAPCAAGWTSQRLNAFVKLLGSLGLVARFS